MAGNNGGPWGGGGNKGGSGGDDDNNRNNGPRRPAGGDQIPELDELLNKGREQFRVLMGGGNGGGNRSGGGAPSGPAFTRGTIGLAAAAAVVVWGMASFYTRCV